MDIQEYESIDDVVALAQFIHEHGKLGAEVLAYYNNDIADAAHALENCYQGEFASEEDFAQSLFEDCYPIPDYLNNYIDYQKVARDLFINDYMSFEVDHKVHVFSYFWSCYKWLNSLSNFLLFIKSISEPFSIHF
jgi:antirestriction protein